MASSSPIEWTDATWNPATGCTKVSPGCKECYAEKLALRWKAAKNRRYLNGFDLTLHEDLVDLPLSWKSPKRIFVNSMSDMFHEDLPFDFIERVFATMVEASWHSFQILTKRATRLDELAPRLPWPENVWMGVSVESEKYLTRIDHLRNVPAAVRFLSLEPLLEPLPHLDLRGIDWIIVGGESGGGARPMEAAWVRAIRDKCQAARVPFFVKQWGKLGNNPDPHDPTAKENGGTAKGGRMLDGVLWDAYPTATRRPGAPTAAGAAASSCATADADDAGVEVERSTATFAKGLGARTRVLYEREIRRFLEHWPGHRITEVGRADVVDYLDALSRQGLGPASRALALAALRSWLGALAAEGVLAKDPTERIRVRVPSGEQRRAEALSWADVRRLLAAPTPRRNGRVDVVAHRDRVLLHLGFSLGLRVSELVRLRVGDLRVNGKPCLSVVLAKTGERQLRLVTPETHAAIRAYLRLRGRLDPSAPLLARHAPGVAGQEPLTPQWIGAILRARAAEAGMGRRVSTHSFRATFVTTAAEAGVPLPRIQRSLGHARLTTTGRYIRYEHDLARDPAGGGNFARRAPRRRAEREESWRSS